MRDAPGRQRSDGQQQRSDAGFTGPQGGRGGQQRSQQAARWEQGQPRGARDGAPRRQQQQQQQQGRAPERARPRLFQGGGTVPSEAGAGSSGASSGADAAAVLLTRQITSCGDWRELQALLEGKLPVMNAVHISAAMHQLSRLVGPRGTGALPEAERRRVALVVEALMERAEGEDVRGGLGGQEISCCVGALARLGVRHPRHVPALLALSAGRLGSFRNQELLHLGWAAARLGYVPHEDWLGEFTDETYDRMAALNEQELGNAVWAFAKWGRPPSADWLDRFLSQLPRCAVRMEPPAICSTLWAAAMLGLKLPPSLVDSILLESQVKFSSFNAHGLATLAWSLCCLDVRPRRLWLDDYVTHTGTRMAGWSNDQCFTNTLWALSNWEHRPPDSWLDECCRLSLPFLGGMSLKSLLILAAALADLDFCPPIQWTSLLLERAHARRADARAAAPPAPGGGAGGARAPGAPAPAAAGAAGVPTAGGAADGAADCATFLWALSRLLRRPKAGSAWAGGSGDAQQQQDREQQQREDGPSASWLRRYRPLLQDLADDVAGSMGQLPVTALVDGVVGCAELGFFPGVAWMDAHEAAVNDGLPLLSAYQFNLVQRAYARLERAMLGARGGGGGGEGEGGEGGGGGGGAAAGEGGQGNAAAAV